MYAPSGRVGGHYVWLLFLHYGTINGIKKEEDSYS